ncbi:helix-turn-helix transcriptional regulator [Amorphus sp. 3PC139-8]|uniref:helix-turn-helix transcriptional regulator n=1 Tax=Amorphus sp. 3PC139-8 TaxID=2735676 RepID=UPI00345D9044
MQSVQFRMARAALGWSAEELAMRAGLAPTDISRLENGSESDPKMAAAARRVFEASGIVFLGPDEPNGPGVCIRGEPLVPDPGLSPEDLNASNDD